MEAPRIGQVTADVCRNERGVKGTVVTQHPIRMMAVEHFARGPARQLFQLPVGHVSEGAEVRIIAAIPERTGRPGAAGVFPLCFGRQGELRTGLARQPVAESHCLLPRDADDGLVRPVHGVAARFDPSAKLADVTAIVGRVEPGVFAVAHLAFAQPEGASDGHATGRALVLASLRLTHQEFAGGNQSQFERRPVAQFDTLLDRNALQ